jgi:hypothetical protein
LACAHNHAVIGQARRRTTAPGRHPVNALRQALGDGHPEVAAAQSGELLDCRIEPTPL